VPDSLDAQHVPDLRETLFNEKKLIAASSAFFVSLLLFFFSPYEAPIERS
jgi:hypothetical protein